MDTLSVASITSLFRGSLLLLIISLLNCCHLPKYCLAVGYSYARFTGPVSGPEHKIIVKDAFSDVTRVDYVARPEYEFAYGVEDGKTRVLQNRKESRDGDTVKGVYSVVDPDGTLRVVKYTADNVNGFQAEVIANGVTTIHGHNGVIKTATAISDEDGDDNGDREGDGKNNGKNIAHWHVETGSAQSENESQEPNTEYSAEDEGSDEQSNHDFTHDDGEYEVYEDYKENDDEETDAFVNANENGDDDDGEDDEDDNDEDDGHAREEKSEEFE